MTLFPRLILLLCALLPLAACAASNATPVEGQDYELIEQPGPFAPLAGKIEVVEVFGYTCPHCAHFEPQLEAWAAKLPADVRFTPVPGAFGGYWDAYARAFYADLKARAAALGRDPARLIVLPGISPFIGSTEAEAHALHQEFDELTQPEYSLHLLQRLLSRSQDQAQGRRA